MGPRWLVEGKLSACRRQAKSLSYTIRRHSCCYGPSPTTISPVTHLSREHHLVHLARPAALAELHLAFLPQPLLDGQREARLAAIPHFRRQRRMRSGGEELLAALFARDEQGCELAQQVRIDERHAHFE